MLLHSTRKRRKLIPHENFYIYGISCKTSARNLPFFDLAQTEYYQSLTQTVSLVFASDVEGDSMVRVRVLNFLIETSNCCPSAVQVIIEHIVSEVSGLMESSPIY